MLPVFHYYGFVTHIGGISTSYTAAQWPKFGPMLLICIISKNASKMFFGKNFVLQWQINSGTIYRYIIGNRFSNFLARKFFLAVMRSSRFYGSIICNNDTLFAFDVTYFLL
jgi:hypothetical protein